MLDYVMKLEFLKGYRTVIAAAASIAFGLVTVIDGDTSGFQSIFTGLGLLGLRFQTSK